MLQPCTCAGFESYYHCICVLDQFLFRHFVVLLRLFQQVVEKVLQKSKKQFAAHNGD